MTVEPARFRKSGKRYYIDGDPVPSVTQIIKEGFPSPALITWAAKSVAGAAVDRWDELAALTPSTRLRTLERAPWEQRDTAALRGTQIHALGEQLLAGQAPTVPMAHLGPVQAYARFLDEFDVQPVLVEPPVAHLEHGWAGTADLLATLRTADGTAVWLLDIKTGRGVYESHVLQVAAYAHAQVYLDGDGNLQQWQRPERVGVVHLTSDSAELLPVDASDRAYTIFRHAAVVAGYARETSQAYKDRRPWPVGTPLHAPEQVST